MFLVSMCWEAFTGALSVQATFEHVCSNLWGFFLGLTLRFIHGDVKVV